MIDVNQNELLGRYHNKHLPGKAILQANQMMTIARMTKTTRNVGINFIIKEINSILNMLKLNPRSKMGLILMTYYLKINYIIIIYIKVVIIFIKSEISKLEFVFSIRTKISIFFI